MIVPEGTRQSKKLIVNSLVSDCRVMSIFTFTFIVKVAKLETLAPRLTVNSSPLIETNVVVFSIGVIVALAE